MKIIDVNKIYEINQILDEKNMGFTLHSHRGCSSCGVELRPVNQSGDLLQTIQVINDYLQPYFMHVKSIEPGSLNLIVES